jgi:hypothetical protein
MAELSETAAAAARRISRAIEAELDELSPTDALALAEHLNAEGWLLSQELGLEDEGDDLAVIQQETG